MRISTLQIYLCVLATITLVGCSAENQKLNLEIDTLKKEVGEIKDKLNELQSKERSGSWILWRRHVGAYTGPGFQSGPSPSTVVAAYSSKEECESSIQPAKDWNFVCLPKGVLAPFAK